RFVVLIIELHLHFSLFSLLLFSVLSFLVAESHSQFREANLTQWREHRRQKRFILYTDAGVCKFSSGIALPVVMGMKKRWASLFALVAIQYQFSVPTVPIYWWDVWKNRALTDVSKNNKEKTNNANYIDEAQILLYNFVVEFMNGKGINGSACLNLAICENAQIHEHRGVYAEILHRILIPHPSVNEAYVDAFRMGRHGVDCRTKFMGAQNCLLDNYVHDYVHDLEKSFLKTNIFNQKLI
ncbi:uncharacterized protein LOC119683535, partial [Teleopsis dalmanni]|uniref:uncharacterized protein LOC119683535 n=1 Tax=Teleopsis dalmanni TaxID=139649 RepID=UPI0018CD77EC